MDEAFAQQLDKHIRAHLGWRNLERFGEQLAAAPLDKVQREVFLASTGEFFREIPGGILALALRVTDDRMQHDRFGATQAGARILYAAVDEYGLGAGHGDFASTHHQLFVHMADRLGVTEAQLVDSASIIPQAEHLAAVTHDSYRELSVPAAVGFHYASEITSDLEFQLCYKGLAAWSQTYNLADTARSDADFFSFYYVHTEVEPLHGSMGEEAVTLYAETAQQRTELLAGARIFMDAYAQFWAELSAALFAADAAITQRA
jgi:hypothetical protein